MIKRLAILIIIVLCTVGGYAGYRWYQDRQTPQYAATTFIKALTADPNKAYKWLSPELTRDREDYWLKYLANFTGKDLVGVTGGSALKDPLDAYPDIDTKKPYRMQYFVNENGAVGATVTLVLVYQGGDWKVDELFDVPRQ